MAVNLGAELAQEWLMAKQVLGTLIPNTDTAPGPQAPSKAPKEDVEYFIFGYIYKYINNIQLEELCRMLDRKDYACAITRLINYSMVIDRNRIREILRVNPRLNHEKKDRQRCSRVKKLMEELGRPHSAPNGPLSPEALKNRLIMIGAAAMFLNEHKLDVLERLCEARPSDMMAILGKEVYPAMMSGS